MTGRHGRRAAGPADPAAVSRTSLPPAGAAETALAHGAARDWADRATDGLPDPWVLEARSGVGPLDALAADLDLAVAGVPLGRPRRPRAWTALGLLQWLLLAVVVAGGLWLAGLAALDALALTSPAPPRWGDVPIPTVGVVGGVVAGLLLAGLGRLLGALSARRQAGRARRALHAAVRDVAATSVVAPVVAVLDRHQQCQDAAHRAAGHTGRRHRGDR